MLIIENYRKRAPCVPKGSSDISLNPAEVSQYNRADTQSTRGSVAVLMRPSAWLLLRPAVEHCILHWIQCWEIPTFGPQKQKKKYSNIWSFRISYSRQGPGEFTLKGKGFKLAWTVWDKMLGVAVTGSRHLKVLCFKPYLGAESVSFRGASNIA